MNFQSRMSEFISVRGVVTEINPITYISSPCGCNKMITMNTEEQGIVNFILGPDTYLSERIPIEVGMELVGFYDSSLPVPLIYPPQFQASAFAFPSSNQQVYLGRFNNNLLARDRSLQLHIGPNTAIFTENGQIFQGNLKNQLLLVFYRMTTRSIPPQTTPEKIIVLCSM